jgi:hypothetical protein
MFDAPPAPPRSSPKEGKSKATRYSEPLKWEQTFKFASMGAPWLPSSRTLSNPVQIDAGMKKQRSLK